MIKLQKIEYISKDVFEACTCNIRGDRKRHIEKSRSAIINSGKEYDKIALKGQLSSIKTHDQVDGGASKAEMVWLYEKKIVADGGRSYYDKIMLLPQNGICPFCGKRIVSTLDHYLPKTKYPTYAITPENLVASCGDCNKIKDVYLATDLRSALLHPYYDDYDDEIWISAQIIEKNPIGFHFEPSKPNFWDETKFTRAKNHFEILKLGKLYSSYAADAFTPYAIQLKRLYLRGRETAVKEDLIDRIESHKAVRKNSLEVAMYSALFNSPWFFLEYLPKSI